MKILISICSLMLAGALASTSYDNKGYGGGGGYGHGGGGHAGAGHAAFSYNDLAQLEKMIHDVGAEKLQVGRRVNMLKNQQATLLAVIQKIQTVTIPEFMSVQDAQDASLEAIRKKIREVHESIDAGVAALDGEVAVAKRQEGLVNGAWARILALVASNNAQAALIAKTNAFLAEAKSTLSEKLEASRINGASQVAELQGNTLALGKLVNTRKCLSITVNVEVDAGGSVTDVAEYYPASFFGGLTPTAYCALVGVTSHINLDRSKASAHGGGYGGYGYSYSDKYQNLALTVDCKPFDDKVVVSVFDQSKGANNIVEKVYVAVKLCTLGAQASGLDHI